MKFRGHETFFIRKGWLYKGMKNVAINPNVFSNKDDNPMDVFGLGNNMVKSLRYWLQAVGLTEECIDHGKKIQKRTKFGELVWNRDRYIEEIGTLDLLQYKLVTNIELATAWFYFFNVFSMQEFKKEDFVKSLENYVAINDIQIARSSLESDFDCMIKTYISRNKYSDNFDPENNIDSPLGELNLIKLVNKKEHIYRKAQLDDDMINPLILLSIIIENAGKEKEIKISRILNDKGNIGKVFNMDLVSLMKVLYKMEKMKYISIVRTAGLDVIRIITEMTAYECCEKYYESLNG